MKEETFKKGIKKWSRREKFEMSVYVIMVSLLYIIGAVIVIDFVYNYQSYMGTANLLENLEYCQGVDLGRVPLYPLQTIDCSIIKIKYFNDCLEWDVRKENCLETYLVFYPFDEELWKTDMSNIGVDGRPINMPERFSECWLVDMKDNIRYFGCKLK